VGGPECHSNVPIRISHVAIQALAVYIIFMLDLSNSFIFPINEAPVGLELMAVPVVTLLVVGSKGPE